MWCFLNISICYLFQVGMYVLRKNMQFFLLVQEMSFEVMAMAVTRGLDLAGFVQLESFENNQPCYFVGGFSRQPQ